MCILIIVIYILLSQSNHLSKLNLIHNWFDSTLNVNTHTHTLNVNIVGYKLGVCDIPNTVRSCTVHKLRVRIRWRGLYNKVSQQHTFRLKILQFHQSAGKLWADWKRHRRCLDCYNFNISYPLRLNKRSYFMQEQYSINIFWFLIFNLDTRRAFYLVRSCVCVHAFFCLWCVLTFTPRS